MKTRDIISSMNDTNVFRFEIKLIVEVEAFDEDDALSAVQDVIGLGPMDSSVNVLQCEYNVK